MLKENREVFSVFKAFHKMICTQFGVVINFFLRFDCGGEYIDYGLGNYFCSQGIIHQTSCTDTPQQNGVAENKNRHLLEVARSMLFSVNTPES